MKIPIRLQSLLLLLFSIVTYGIGVSALNTGTLDDMRERVASIEPIPDPYMKIRKRFPSYHKFILKSARKHHVSATWIASIILIESQGKWWTRGSSGEYGLMQLMPVNLEAMGIPKDKWLDPETNIEAGTRYFKYCLKLKRGNLKVALLAYNAGPHRIKYYNLEYFKVVNMHHDSLAMR